MRSMVYWQSSIGSYINHLFSFLHKATFHFKQRGLRVSTEWQPNQSWKERGRYPLNWIGSKRFKYKYHYCILLLCVTLCGMNGHESGSTFAYNCGPIKNGSGHPLATTVAITDTVAKTGYRSNDNKTRNIITRSSGLIYKAYPPPPLCVCVFVLECV